MAIEIEWNAQPFERELEWTGITFLGRVVQPFGWKGRGKRLLTCPVDNKKTHKIVQIMRSDCKGSLKCRPFHRLNEFGLDLSSEGVLYFLGSWPIGGDWRAESSDQVNLD
jgi:hypothetical protein